MHRLRAEWVTWADHLRHLNLADWFAWLLEASAPFVLLGAQALFIARPLLGEQSEALADLLEDEEARHAFAAYLREEELR